MSDQKTIRNTFIDFFREKNHVFIPSAPLIPQGDKSLLFVNSGMVPFKEIFVGEKKSIHKRACNSQKCIRLSGKHNDLEEVGFDSYHHTLFEMLGSWSFADYYKKEAITYAWELLTKVWHLDKNKLYITVHNDDNEAFILWEEETDVKNGHIRRFGDEHNFWEMAQIGPCGPSSEVHIDIGAENCTCKNAGDQKNCAQNGAGINTGCGRYIEIWNLVFIEYYRHDDENLEPLKEKFIDTGMGFERIVAVLQDKKSNYDTDIFNPYILDLERKTKISYKKEEKASENPSLKAIAFRIIADHIRSISFSIADGVIPSNEGRGYVIRRLIRRAYRFGRELGFREPFLYEMVDIVSQQMGEHFKEIVENKQHVTQTLLREEQLFGKTLERGLVLLQNLAEKKQKNSEKKISGKEAFELYDTFGFPLDLTTLIAKENNLTVDKEDFNREMAQQKERSRQDLSKKNSSSFIEMARLVKIATQYHGELENDFYEGKVIALFCDGKPVDQLNPLQEGFLCFDKTVFYAEGGGQVGDIGYIFNDNGKKVAKVIDTVKQNNIYFIKINTKEILTKKNYVQHYDHKRREAIRKNHSAVHLLQKALMEILGDHIRQAGSFVNEEKLRFDFNHTKPLEKKEKEALQKIVQEKIKSNISTKIEILPKEQALELGARAFFEEKYGENVRVVSLGKYSVELCGGSHVKSSSEIGGFAITYETSVASGIRRIEAITGHTINRLYLKKQQLLQNVMKQLHLVNESELLKKVDTLLAENKRLSQTIENHFAEKAKQQLLENCQDFHETFIYKSSLGEISPKLARKILEDFLQFKSWKNPIVVIASSFYHEKANLFLAYHDKNKKRPPFESINIIKKAGEFIDGNGGGNPNFCQAGGKKSEKIIVALEMVEKEVKACLLKNV